MEPKPNQMPSSNKFPEFPDWSAVLHRLYSTDIFKTCGLDTESLSHYLKQRRVFKEKYRFPVSGPDLISQSFDLMAEKNYALSAVSEEEIIEKYNLLNATANQFTLLGNSNEVDFYKISENARDLLNLPSEKEINLHRISGLDEAFELYHPEDVMHIVRLGLSAIFLTTIKGVRIDPFQDYYQVRFRIGHTAPHRFFTISRTCRLSNQDHEKPGTRHLDVWQVERGHHLFEHVKAYIETKEPGPMQEVVQSLFYATNCYLLHLSPRDVILANLIHDYSENLYSEEFNRKLCETLGQEKEFYSKSQCHSLKSNLLKKVDKRVLFYTKEVPGSEAMDRQYFTTAALKRNYIHKFGQLGILKVPPLLCKSIWEGVCHS